MALRNLEDLAHGWRQLSTAIVFGLGFATVLTLLVTPCALLLRVNVAAWLQRRRQNRRHGAALQAARSAGADGPPAPRGGVIPNLDDNDP